MTEQKSKLDQLVEEQEALLAEAKSLPWYAISARSEILRQVRAKQHQMLVVGLRESFCEGYNSANRKGLSPEHLNSLTA